MNFIVSPAIVSRPGSGRMRLPGHGGFRIGLVILMLLSAPLVYGADLYAVAATIPVGPSPQGVEVNPSTNRIYVACYNAGKVFVIDGATNKVVGRVQTGFRPVGVAVNGSSNRVFVSDYGGNRVAVLDGDTNRVLNTITVVSPHGVGGSHRTSPVSDEAWRVAVNPETNRVYVASFDSRAVFVIDGATNRILGKLDRTIAMELRPSGVGVNPVTNVVYVTYHGSNRVDVHDGFTYAAMNSVSVGESRTVLEQPGVNPANNQVYVACFDADTLSVIGGATNRFPQRVIARVPMPSSSMGVAVDDAANLVYVANSGSNGIVVIDGNTNLILSRVATGRGPVGVAVNSRTGRIYVTSSERGVDAVSVVAVPTPRQATQLLAERVRSLIGRGVLRQGQGDALLATLRAVIELLERGEFNSARDRLQVLVGQVEALRSMSSLPRATAEALKNAAQAMLSELGDKVRVAR
jgi:YVTN family beta-propeller protein